MSVLTRATKAFDQVNLTGQLSDRLTNPNVLLRYAVSSEVKNMRAQTLRRRAAARNDAPQTLRTKAGAVAAAAGSKCKTAAHTGISMAGINLAVRRSLPLFWFRQESPLPLRAIGNFLRLPRLGVAVSWTPMFAAGELLLGRGNNNSNVIPVGFDLLNRIALWQDGASRYGLAGLALERGPASLSQRYAERGHHGRAAACMMAAVVGRSILQLPRLALLGATLLFALTETVMFVGVMLVFELLCRSILLSVSAYTKMTGHTPTSLHSVIDPMLRGAAGWRGMVQLFAARELRPDELNAAIIDDGGSGANGRVLDRAAVLLLRFAAAPAAVPGETEDQAAAREDAWALEMANTISEDLRFYCSDLPTNEALRGGLSQVKAFMEQSFPDAGYDPAELRANN